MYRSLHVVTVGMVYYFQEEVLIDVDRDDSRRDNFKFCKSLVITGLHDRAGVGESTGVAARNFIRRPQAAA